MTAQLTAPAASTSVVLMTADEARACVDRIKAGLEDIRVAGLDLEEREGWKALNYSSWRECVADQFGKSVATVYRQLRAGKVDREISQVEKSPVHLPTVQAEELLKLPDTESRQTAYLVAKEATNGNLTQTAVQTAVQQVAAERRHSPTRHTDPSISQDIPDDLYTGPAGDPDDLGPRDDADPFDGLVNQEPYAGSPNAERWCRICGDKYRGKVCPCGGPTSVAEATTDPYEQGNPFDGLVPHPDGVSAPISAEDAALLTTDRPGAAGDADSAGAPNSATATDAGEGPLPPSTPAPPARPHSSEQEDRPLGEPAARTNGKGGLHKLSAGAFSARALDAGDLTRALLDKPIAQVIEAISESATPAQVTALREALSGATSDPVPAPKVDIREALGDDGCTVLELTTAIGETFTVDARVSLLALLADAMPADRLGPLAHRLVDPEPMATTGPRTPAEIDAEIAQLSVGLQRSVVSRVVDRLDTNDLLLMETRIRTRRERLQQTATNGSR